MEVTTVGANGIKEKEAEIDDSLLLNNQEEENLIALNETDKLGDDDITKEDVEKEEFVVWADDTEGDVAETAKAKKDYGIEMSKDSDELLVTWRGKELRVPCKEEVARDMRFYNRQLHLVAYPLCLNDLDEPALNSCLKKAIHINLELTEAVDGPPIKGILKVRFSSMIEVRNFRAAIDALPPFEKKVASTTEVQKVAEEKKVGEGEEKKEGEGEMKKEGDAVKEDDTKRKITVTLYSEHSTDSAVMSEIKSPHSKDVANARLVFIGNIPLESTEEHLMEYFEGCERVLIPCKDAKNKGYAYVQYENAEKADEALSTFKEKHAVSTGWFAIRAIDQGKAEIGLLKDELRSYWLEQVKNLDGVDRSSKSAKELSEIDQKLVRYKKRIITDNMKRQEFGFVIDECDLYTLPESVMKEETKPSRDRSTSRRQTSRKRSRSRRRRSSPFTKRRAPRGGGGSYGGSRRSSNNSEGTILVSQLQQLVGALSNISNQGVSNNFANQYNNPYSRAGGGIDDRARYDGLGHRGRFDNYDSDRKRRYDDDSYGGRYNDYRGFRGGQGRY